MQSSLMSGGSTAGGGARDIGMRAGGRPEQHGWHGTGAERCAAGHQAWAAAGADESQRGPCGARAAAAAQQRYRPAWLASASRDCAECQ